jgi:hypothetical protein
MSRKLVTAWAVRPWSGILLERLTFGHVVRRFLVFYATRRFITVFARTCHLSLFWSRWLHSGTWHSSSLRSPGSPGWFHSLSFRTKILYAFLISLTMQLIIIYLITQIISGEQYKSLSSSLCNCLQSSITTASPLRTNIVISTLFSQPFIDVLPFGREIKFPI